MMKAPKNKMIGSGETDTKDAGALPRALVCVRECVCPGYGSFQAGEVVSGTALVQALIQSPYFKPQEDK